MKYLNEISKSCISAFKRNANAIIEPSIPNVITVSRIAASIIMIAFSPLSFPFFALYMFCGATDILDGFTARKMHIESEKGAVLDSMADIIFVAVCILKLIPVVVLSNWQWIWIGAIALERVANAFLGCVFCKRLVLLHTKANKLTGLLVFAYPFFCNSVHADWYLLITCAIASFAALQENMLIRKNNVSFNGENG